MRQPQHAPEWMSSSGTLVLPCDFVDLNSVNRAVGETLESFGSIDVAFAKAGYSLNGPIE